MHLSPECGRLIGQEAMLIGMRHLLTNVRSVPWIGDLQRYACWRLVVGSASERARGGRKVRAMATAPRPMPLEPM